MIHISNYSNPIWIKLTAQAVVFSERTVRIVLAAASKPKSSNSILSLFYSSESCHSSQSQKIKQAYWHASENFPAFQRSLKYWFLEQHFVTLTFWFFCLIIFKVKFNPGEHRKRKDAAHTWPLLTRWRYLVNRGTSCLAEEWKHALQRLIKFF